MVWVLFFFLKRSLSFILSRDGWCVFLRIGVYCFLVIIFIILVESNIC